MDQNYNVSGDGGQGGNLFRIIIGIVLLAVGFGIFTAFYGFKLDLGFDFSDIKDLFTEEKKETTRVKPQNKEIAVVGPKTKKAKKIPLKDITLITFKFFEAGYHVPDQKDIVYTKTFLKENTRYVWWKLRYKNNNYNIKKVNIPLKMRWYNPKGKLYTKDDITLNAKENWKKGWYIWGWGWDKPGSWKRGKYTVKLYYKNILFASNSYIVK